jgi:hypothetical protein
MRLRSALPTSPVIVIFRIRGLLCEHRKPETEEREEGGIVWTGRHVWEGGRAEDICEMETMVVFLWQRTKLSVFAMLIPDV